MFTHFCGTYCSMHLKKLQTKRYYNVYKYTHSTSTVIFNYISEITLSHKKIKVLKSFHSLCPCVAPADCWTGREAVGVALWVGTVPSGAVNVCGKKQQLHRCSNDSEAPPTDLIPSLTCVGLPRPTGRERGYETWYHHCRPRKSVLQTVAAQYKRKNYHIYT